MVEVAAVVVAVDMLGSVQSHHKLVQLRAAIEEHTDSPSVRVLVQLLESEEHIGLLFLREWLALAAV